MLLKDYLQKNLDERKRVTRALIPHFPKLDAIQKDPVLLLEDDSEVGDDESTLKKVLTWAIPWQQAVVTYQTATFKLIEQVIVLNKELEEFVGREIIHGTVQEKGRSLIAKTVQTQFDAQSQQAYADLLAVAHDLTDRAHAYRTAANEAQHTIGRSVDEATWQADYQRWKATFSTVDLFKQELVYAEAILAHVITLIPDGIEGIHITSRYLREHQIPKIPMGVKESFFIIHGHTGTVEVIPVNGNGVSTSEDSYHGKPATKVDISFDKFYTDRKCAIRIRVTSTSGNDRGNIVEQKEFEFIPIEDALGWSPAQEGAWIGPTRGQYLSIAEYTQLQETIQLASQAPQPVNESTTEDRTILVDHTLSLRIPPQFIREKELVLPPLGNLPLEVRLDPTPSVPQRISWHLETAEHVALAPPVESRLPFGKQTFSINVAELLKLMGQDASATLFLRCQEDSANHFPLAISTTMRWINLGGSALAPKLRSLKPVTVQSFPNTVATSILTQEQNLANSNLVFFGAQSYLYFVIAASDEDIASHVTFSVSARQPLTFALPNNGQRQHVFFISKRDLQGLGIDKIGFVSVTMHYANGVEEFSLPLWLKESDIADSQTEFDHKIDVLAQTVIARTDLNIKGLALSQVETKRRAGEFKKLRTQLASVLSIEPKKCRIVGLNPGGIIPLLADKELPRDVAFENAYTGAFITGPDNTTVLLPVGLAGQESFDIKYYDCKDSVIGMVQQGPRVNVSAFKSVEGSTQQTAKGVLVESEQSILNYRLDFTGSYQSITTQTPFRVDVEQGHVSNGRILLKDTDVYLNLTSETDHVESVHACLQSEGRIIQQGGYCLVVAHPSNQIHTQARYFLNRELVVQEIQARKKPVDLRLKIRPIESNQTYELIIPVITSEIQGTPSATTPRVISAPPSADRLTELAEQADAYLTRNQQPPYEPSKEHLRWVDAGERMGSAIKKGVDVWKSRRQTPSESIPEFEEKPTVQWATQAQLLPPIRLETINGFADTPYGERQLDLLQALSESILHKQVVLIAMDNDSTIIQTDLVPDEEQVHASFSLPDGTSQQIELTQPGETVAFAINGQALSKMTSAKETKLTVITQTEDDHYEFEVSAWLVNGTERNFLLEHQKSLLRTESGEGSEGRPIRVDPSSEYIEFQLPIPVNYKLKYNTYKNSISTPQLLFQNGVAQLPVAELIESFIGDAEKRMEESPEETVSPIIRIRVFHQNNHAATVPVEFFWVDFSNCPQVMDVLSNQQSE